MSKKQAPLRYITVEEYHAQVDLEKRPYLDEMHRIIKEVIPNAKPCIRYNMPAFFQDGVVVYYAAFKQHIGLYPTAGPIHEMKRDLLGYKTSKGAIQFPYQSLPKDLIQAVVRLRIQQMKDAKRS